MVYRFRRDDASASELIGRLSERLRLEDLALREPEIESTVRRLYERGPEAAAPGRAIDPP